LSGADVVRTFEITRPALVTQPVTTVRPLVDPSVPTASSHVATLGGTAMPASSPTTRSAAVRTAAHGRRTALGRRVALAVAAAALGTVVAPGTAHAAASGPLPGPGCARGYAAVTANSTFTGGAGGVRPGYTGDIQRWNEVVGVGCLYRWKGTAKYNYRWSSVGRLLTGLFSYDLFDCTTRSYPQQYRRSMQYPQGSRGTSGFVAAQASLDPAHRYALRINGWGSYVRPNQSMAASVGYLTPVKRGDIRPFSSMTACM
jgi:hypothetical protein